MILNSWNHDTNIIKYFFRRVFGSLKKISNICHRPSYVTYASGVMRTNLEPVSRTWYIYIGYSEFQVLFKKTYLLNSYINNWKQLHKVLSHVIIRKVLCIGAKLCWIIIPLKLLRDVVDKWINTIAWEIEAPLGFVHVLTVNACWILFIIC